MNPSMWVIYNRGLRDYKNTTEIVTAWRDVKVFVIWGPTGSGKTRQAIKNGKDSWYKLNENSNSTLWFDGYNGETTLILDDFYGWIKWGDLLTLLDGYPYRCQLKGSYCWAKWTKVIITSNKEPKDWYHCIQDISPLSRRITKTYFLKKK